MWSLDFVVWSVECGVCSFAVFEFLSFEFFEFLSSRVL